MKGACRVATRSQGLNHGSESHAGARVSRLVAGQPRPAPPPTAEAGRPVPRRAAWGVPTTRPAPGTMAGAPASSPALHCLECSRTKKPPLLGMGTTGDLLRRRTFQTRVLPHG